MRYLAVALVLSGCVSVSHESRRTVPSADELTAHLHAYGVRLAETTAPSLSPAAEGVEVVAYRLGGRLTDRPDCTTDPDTSPRHVDPRSARGLGGRGLPVARCQATPPPAQLRVFEFAGPVELDLVSEVYRGRTVHVYASESTAVVVPEGVLLRTLSREYGPPRTL